MGIVSNKQTCKVTFVQDAVSPTEAHHKVEELNFIFPQKMGPSKGNLKLEV